MTCGAILYARLLFILLFIYESGFPPLIYSQLLMLRGIETLRRRRAANLPTISNAFSTRR